MNTQIIKTNGISINNDILYNASEILTNGGLVVFPTETVYGLGGDGTSHEAAKKIYSAKGRPSDNPLIIHIAEPQDAEKYAVTSPTYYKLAKAFMPGPLTIILPKKDVIPLSVTGGLETVALRCPSHPIAHQLIKAFGKPIAAPSANLSGKPSPTCARHVIDDLNGKVDMIIDGGNCEIGLESTIVKLDNDIATLLRPGAITSDALNCVCTSVIIAPSVVEQLKSDERPLSPGMKYKHYAPSVPFVLVDGKSNNVINFFKQEQLNRKCAILCYHEDLPILKNTNIIDIGSKTDLEAQAHNLFTALRDADSLDIDIIYAHMPSKNGLGLALYNRMIRAAAHTIIKV